MPTPPICAHRCAQVQALAMDLERAGVAALPIVRISRGLTREYVPVTARPTYDDRPPCPRCGDICMSVLGAAECCDPSSSED